MLIALIIRGPQVLLVQVIPVPSKGVQTLRLANLDCHGLAWGHQ